uniref:GPS domain-containing protein n=1 Tax=Vannella robusta TaxID=1487602 RepID=A0A7S4IQV7_9EUKA
MPLRYVFSVIPVTCEGTELPNGKCPLIPISNSVEYPRFDALLPAGEYFPAVDVFDRLGSSRRFIAPFTITSFDTCPSTPDLMTNYMKRLAVIARAFDCLSDSDSVRQIVNIASVSLSCVEFEIPEETMSVYFNELETILNQIDEQTYSTEIFVDNRVKSFLLSSTLPLSQRPNDVGTLLQSSRSIAMSAQENGFLHDDTSPSLLSGLSNLLNGEIAASDVASVFETLNGIGGGQLRDRTCDTIVSDVNSSIIRMRNQRSSPSSLAGSELSAPGSSGGFKLPNQISGSDCINYVVVDFDMNSFDDGNSTVASLPSSLTLMDSNNSEIQLQSSEPIEIRIPVTESRTDQQYVCASWNEENAAWEEDCEFLREEEGFYIMQSSHLTTFSVLLDGDNGGGGGGITITVSTFGSFATYFTGATEIFGESNLDEQGNLLSSFTALSDIPTEAFATSNEVYDILQYSYSPSDNDYGWTIDRILSLAFTGAAIICVIASIMLLSIPAVRDRLSGKADRTKRVMARAEQRRREELESLNENYDMSNSTRGSSNF